MSLVYVTGMASEDSHNVSDGSLVVDHEHEDGKVAVDRSSHLQRKSDTEEEDVPADDSTATDNSEQNTSNGDAEDHDVSLEEPGDELNSLSNVSGNENDSLQSENRSAGDIADYNSHDHSLASDAQLLLSDALKSPAVSITSANPNLSSFSVVGSAVNSEVSSASTAAVSDNSKPLASPASREVSEPQVSAVHAAVSSTLPQVDSNARPHEETPVKSPASGSKVVQNSEISSTSSEGARSTPSQGYGKEERVNVESQVHAPKTEVKKIAQREDKTASKQTRALEKVRHINSLSHF